MNLSHDIGFTFHVNVGAGFIEEVHRAVVEQCASKRQPLALAAREIRRLLCQPGIQSLRFSEEVRQLHLLQRHPQSILPGIRTAHEQIFPNRSLKQIALMADIGKALQQALL